MAGTETRIRQARGCAPAVGRTSGTGLGTTPIETANTEPDADDGGFSCSDAAQQLSASVWLTDLFGLESGESDLCIGHAPPWEQQAIRASGVAIRPAHRATWLAESANVKRRAGRRLKISTVPARMLERRRSVNRGL